MTADQQELEVETWAEKTERLCRELKALRFNPFTVSKTAREKHAAKRLELLTHLDLAGFPE